MPAPRAPTSSPELHHLLREANALFLSLPMVSRYTRGWDEQETHSPRRFGLPQLLERLHNRPLLLIDQSGSLPLISPIRAHASSVYFT